MNNMYSKYDDMSRLRWALGIQICPSLGGSWVQKLLLSFMILGEPGSSVEMPSLCYQQQSCLNTQLPQTTAAPWAIQCQCHQHLSDRDLYNLHVLAAIPIIDGDSQHQ